MTELLTTLRPAEFVLPGHPDKLADAIADAIVDEAHSREKRALVAVEVALHRDTVFIDGCVACQGAEEINFRRLVRRVYADIGYGGEFGPALRGLKIRTDLVLRRLTPGEAELREVSDDQVISVGYACSTPGTDMLPVEQALAKRMAGALDRLRRNDQSLQLGPDGKVLVLVREEIGGADWPVKWTLQQVTTSLQHKATWDPLHTRRIVRECLLQQAHDMAAAVPGFKVADKLDLRINPVGDFVEGGPYGDNGLSGKKLVMDGYGPRVPIGGGATAGKDRWKADVRGPRLARKRAVDHVLRLGWRECTVTLVISPGERQFTTAAIEGKSVEALSSQFQTIK